MKHGSNILIVDDEQGARDILEALLIPEGHNLAFASNGAEALKKASELTPSLILLDVMMPEMDGFEVCRRLRSDPLLAEVPVVMITALDDHDSRLQGIEVGADDFISKPFDRGELKARVRSIIRLDRYRRLLQERAKFEWVIRQADDGYLIIDNDDKVLYANARARLYLGLPPIQSEHIIRKESELSSETFLELAQKQYRLEPQEVWATWPEQPIGSTLPQRYLVCPETSTADAFWLQVDSFELSSESEIGKVLRLRDVTAQIISQRNRRGFHTMICHKLRTPLVGLLGSLGFMVQHASTLSNKEVAEFSEMAFKSVQRLHSEIEDILQYLNTPSVGRLGECYNLAHFQSLVNRIKTDLNLKSVNVAIQEGLSDVRIVLSQQAVELMMWELLENSEKFHPYQNPRVEITVSRSGSEDVSFKIQDDGLSLSPEQLSQMWTPYYQGEKYSTGEVKGMGLGLSVVASLIWEAGGTCNAYNRKDKAGVTVELIVPLAKDIESEK